MRQIVTMLVLVLLLNTESARALDLYVEESPNNHFINIVLTDAISPGDAQRFKEVILSIMRRTDKPIMFIKTYTPGGSVYDAIEIGRMTRILRANTNAPFLTNGQNVCYSLKFGGQFSYDRGTHTGNALCDCASACFLIWAAGWARRGSVLGVHRMRFSDIAELSTLTAEERYKKAMTDEKSYLEEMGIPDEIINKNFITGSDTLRYLTPEELQPILGLAPSTYELVVGRCGAAEARADRGICIDKIRWEEALEGNRQFRAIYGP